MKIYIDVTNLVSVNFLTGIQRVVYEVVTRLLVRENEIILLKWDKKEATYKILDNNSFVKLCETELSERNKNIFVNEKENWELDNIEDLSEIVFFDLDSVWNAFVKRSYLYSVLKKKNARIVTLIHDVIPVLYSKYCHSNTVYHFYDYLSAVLKYSDKLLVTTENTKHDVEEILEKNDLSTKKIEVVPLGADFRKKDNSNEKVREDAQEAVAAGKYLLLVGTIEPRKNHEFLMDCFEKYLLDEEVNLVFAGRIGWNIEAFEARLRNHDLLGKRIFFIESANDKTIEFLYKNAFLFVFPSVYEGYGLPIIETLEQNTPALVSDIAVFREVGKNYCDYFSLEKLDELANIIKKYLNDDQLYFKRKQEIKYYQKPTWDAAVDGIEQAIDSLKVKNKLLSDELQQIFILSARENELLELFPYVEKYMCFIKKALICCPEKKCTYIKEKYRGFLKLEFITDEELLQDITLPKDHAERNFLLRCLAMKSEKLDNQFLMYDDDYRPLMEITINDFIAGQKYRAYYCHELTAWRGTAGNPTSYDLAMFRTREFLQKEGYPTKQYSSHMPQIINKEIFLEMLEEYLGMQFMAYDEWSTYFNYAIFHYPQNFQIEKFKTLCWPATPTDWEMEYLPDEYIFENFYPTLYSSKEIFENCALDGGLNNPRENINKIMMRHQLQQKYETNKTTRKILDKFYQYIYQTEPNYVIDFSKNNSKLITPKLFYSATGFCNKVLFTVTGFDWINEKDWDTTLSYRFELANGEPITKFFDVNVLYQYPYAEFAIYAPKIPGEYVLRLICHSKHDRNQMETAISAWVYEL